MNERSFWLKAVGAAEEGLEQAEDWPDTAPQELHEVHFPDKGKPSVKSGDYLVYYASGQGRIIGIVEAFTPPTKDSGEERWPWRCQVRPRIIINRISRSPSLDVMSGPQRNLRESVKQQSHISITDDEYHRAIHALEETFDPGQGDRFFPWFSFETRLQPDEAGHRAEVQHEASETRGDGEHLADVKKFEWKPGMHLVGDFHKGPGKQSPGKSIFEMDDGGNEKKTPPDKA